MNMPLRREAEVSTATFNMSRHMMVAVTLSIALIAFEIFNYDTTEYALSSLLGHKSFVGLQWSAILAVAFCAIDFAGLARIFTPQKGWNEPKEVWYLMGAWLLGATMNAVMTWWAVSLTLLEHNFGNEVLSRQQLLEYVPIFVAALVWLTRILFIGALSVAGDHIFNFHGDTMQQPVQAKRKKKAKAKSRQQATLRQSASTRRRPVQEPLIEDELFEDEHPTVVMPAANRRQRTPNTRAQQANRRTAYVRPKAAPRTGSSRRSSGTGQTTYAPMPAVAQSNNPFEN